MLRISKDPLERKNEIIDIAEELFRTQGFERTTVSDIVKKIGVAQGLFYYYFKSKDEVLEAIAERLADLLLTKTETIVANESLSPLAKLRRILVDIINFTQGKEEVMTPIHQVSHEQLHQKVTTQIMDRLVPLCLQVVREGMQQGIFKIDAPEVTVEILLSGLEHYTNRMIRECLGRPEFNEKIQLAVQVLERALGAPSNSLKL